MFSSRCTKNIETFQVNLIGATVTTAIPTLTTATSPKRNNVTWHVPINTAALVFVENVSHRRTTHKDFLRLIMLVQMTDMAVVGVVAVVGEVVAVAVDMAKRKNDKQQRCVYFLKVNSEDMISLFF